MSQVQKEFEVSSKRSSCSSVSDASKKKRQRTVHTKQSSKLILRVPSTTISLADLALNPKFVEQISNLPAYRGYLDNTRMASVYIKLEQNNAPTEPVSVKSLMDTMQSITCYLLARNFALQSVFEKVNWVSINTIEFNMKLLLIGERFRP